MSLVTGLFSLVHLLLNQRRFPSLFMFQTAVLSALCVMFLAELYFIVNLLTVFLVGFQTFL